jgi:hypothetical protein
MKKPELYLKEYCQKLSDDELKFIGQRLSQRLSGDLPEVFDYFKEIKEIDRWLLSATTCDELFDMVDLVDAACQKETDKRNQHEQKNKKE